MKLKTTQFLTSSVIVIGLAFLVSSFWEFFNLSMKETTFLLIAFISTFMINLVGVGFALFEVKTHRDQAMKSLIGHLFMILCFVGIAIYAWVLLN